MKQSHLFTKARKQSPKGEVSKNAQLLIRAGFVHKEMAGVFSYLPLGLRVLEKINNIIREEMNMIGGQEVYLSAMQDSSSWKKTDRWDEKENDVWFKTRLRNGNDVGLGWTHEEPLTSIVSQHINSYKDLPRYIYQIQTKFRNEVRAKSGIMRGREFLMKDLYSFSRSQEEHDSFYEQVKKAYTKIFKRLGIGKETFVTFASGGAFSKYSHEFQTISEAGEDTIYVDEKKKIAINKEVLNKEVLSQLGLNKKNLVEKKAIEVGNIFNLGTKYSEPLGLDFIDDGDKKVTTIMGSYGIGPTRVMGTIAEVYADDNGLVWPESVAPFSVHLVSLCADKKDIKEADKLYKTLLDAGIEVLYDDRQGVRAGEKFAESDLIGIPKRIVISSKTIKEGKLEIKERRKQKPTFVPVKKVLSAL